MTITTLTIDIDGVPWQLRITPLRIILDVKSEGRWSGDLFVDLDRRSILIGNPPNTSGERLQEFIDIAVLKAAKKQRARKAVQSKPRTSSKAKKRGAA